MPAQEAGEWRPYRVVGAYDSETCNLEVSGQHLAFPVLHQIGILDVPIEQVTADNVEQVTKVYMYRHTARLYEALDNMVAAGVPYVPVILCHNLGFDMYGLSEWLGRHDVDVLAKSQRKPISFAIKDSRGNHRLVIWDTLGFSGHGLAYMGDECGYPKLSGDWDYGKVRTPETPLTTDEATYAKHDVYALLAWMGYWCRLNPDMRPDFLGRKVVTKTGIVRVRRVQRFGRLRPRSDDANPMSLGKLWAALTYDELPKSDDELYTYVASTRGGLTFCASRHASVPYDLPKGQSVVGYDATSQHPSQIVSHRYPVGFRKATAEELGTAFDVVCAKGVDDVLGCYARPFGVAFDGCFELTNLRPKHGTVYEREGIYPLAWARFRPYQTSEAIYEDGQQGEDFKAHAQSLGYADQVVDGTHAFGKLVSARRCRLWLTELAAWELSRAYEWDECKAASGFLTMAFAPPTDMAAVSVMQFYKAKRSFKQARKDYYSNRRLSNADELRCLGIPDFVVTGMDRHEIDDSVVESTYLGLKADLNALFGIEACNEFRRDTVMTDDGIDYEGEEGIVNAPEHPKAWYQCGQRIVGWSRVAQILVMELVAPYVDGIVNGDTDSVKLLMRDDALPSVEAALGRLSDAIDRAKADTCERVRRQYPQAYDELAGIGHYTKEFSTRQLCAAWNKCYVVNEYDPRDDSCHMSYTIAGVPSRKLGEMADDALRDGATFGQVCDLTLGYNVTYAHDMTGLNARAFPKWGSRVHMRVVDWLGEAHDVDEPAALCLYPMAKCIGDTGKPENLRNAEMALENRPSVNVRPVIISNREVIDL